MKKRLYVKKVIAVGSVVVLACTATACGKESAAGQTAVSAAQNSATEEEKNLMDTMNHASGGILSQTQEADKEETVYVIADSKGMPSRVIVSEWLKNFDSVAKLSDYTNLKKIENVKGNESFQTTADGIEWDAKGSDIYYQGTTNQELPVSVQVTYYLNGKEIAPEELAGKSGEVKIRYEYTNHSISEQNIDGRKTEIYTPFVMATGLILPTDTFKNVKVSNGSVISEGDKMIAFGMAMPGMSDNLAFDEFNDIDIRAEIPDSFEITATVEDFSLGMSLTFASNTMFDWNQILNTDKSGTLKEKMDDLTKGADQLEEGSQKLAQGTATLNSKVGEFGSGLRELAKGITDYTDGVKSLKNGAQKLADGAAVLDAGAADLSEGLGTAKSGASALEAGAANLKNGAQTLASGTADAKSGAQNLENGAKSLDSGAKQVAQGTADAKDGAQSMQSGAESLDSAAKQVAQGTADAKSGAEQLLAGFDGDHGAVSGAAALTAGLNQLNERVQALQLPELNTESAKLTEEQKAAVEQQLNAYFASEAGQTVLAQYTDSFVQGVMAAMQQNGAQLDDPTKAVLEATISGACKQTFTAIYLSAYESGMEKGMEEVLNQVSAQMAAFDPGISELKQAAGQLSAGAGELSQGISQLYGGTQQLDSGLAQLKDGTAALSGGAGELYDGSKTLNSGLTQLKDGTTALSGGAGELYDGSKSLNHGLVQLKDGTAALSAGASELYDGSKSFSGGLSQLVGGVSQLRAGTVTLKDGTNTLLAGSVKLDGASAQLLGGSKALEDGSSQLVSGVSELHAGALELKDGMIRFNEDGISKIADIYHGDITKLKNRLQAVADCNSSYELFGGIEEGKKGVEKFVIKIDGIE